VISTAYESFSLIRTVRAFAGEQVEQQKFNEEVEKEQELSTRFGYGIALLRSIAFLILYC
jgi:hypothetical protein